MTKVHPPRVITEPSSVKHPTFSHLNTPNARKPTLTPKLPSANLTTPTPSHHAFCNLANDPLPLELKMAMIPNPT